MSRFAIMAACCAIVVWGGAAQSAPRRAVQTGTDWRKLQQFLSPDLACTGSTSPPGHPPSRHRFDCYIDGSGLEQVRIMLSPNRHSLRALQMLVTVQTRDLRVPLSEVRRARRSMLRLIRFIVPDNGQSAQWTERAAQRVIRTGRCMQAHHSKGYSLSVLSMSPIDREVTKVEVTIAFGPSANPYLEDECF